MPMLKTSAAPQTDIHYVDIGDGPAVVLVHGWPLSHRMWETQINGLVDAGFRCIAYDRRGFGDSGKPVAGYDYDTLASDLNDVMTTLDLHNVALAGFSMGGGEVARYIGHYGTGRLSKAMLLGAVTPFMLKTADNPQGADGAAFDGMVAGLKADRLGFLDQFFANFYNWDAPHAGVSDDLILFSKFVAWNASPAATQQCVTAFGTTDFRSDLAKFDLPTMIMHGDADRIVPFETSGKLTAAIISGSRVELLKGAPHGFAATHAAQLTALMLDFLQE